MATRDEVMQHWGPRLLEAFALMVLDEINILRAQAGLAPRTPQQILDNILNHHSHCDPYDWMQTGQ